MAMVCSSSARIEFSEGAYRWREHEQGDTAEDPIVVPEDPEWPAEHPQWDDEPYAPESPRYGYTDFLLSPVHRADSPVYDPATPLLLSDLLGEVEE